MIGLEPHQRDAGLPARAGDASLTPPSERALLELVREHMCAPGAAPPSSARWVYARWKPGTALLAAYRIGWTDGAERTVSIKFHSGAKAGTLADRRPDALPADVRDDRLLAAAALPGENAYLTAFPYDRQLPGLGRALDLRRTARLLRSLGLFAPLRMRPGPSRVEVLRYKPERRAVLSLDLRLRPPGHGPRSEARLVARVLAPADAQSVARRRLAFEARAREANAISIGAPRLAACEPRTGLLLEPWVKALPSDPEQWADEALAARAGAALAQLHAVPLGGPECHRPARTAPDAHGALFAIDARLGERARALRERPAVAGALPVWVHGDFHAGQVALDEADEARLFDLDELDVGEATADLANWIAEALARAPEVGLRAAGGGLLTGYEAAGGRPVDRERLCRAIADALVDRAAGCLRRLEEHAVERSLRLLERAADLDRTEFGP